MVETGVDVVVARVVAGAAVLADVVTTDELDGVDEPVAALVVLITAVVATAGPVVVAATTGAELAGVAARSFPHAAPTSESTTQAVTRRVETVRMKVPPTTWMLRGNVTHVFGGRIIEAADVSPPRRCCRST